MVSEASSEPFQPVRCFAKRFHYVVGKIARNRPGVLDLGMGTEEQGHMIAQERP